MVGKEYTKEWNKVFKSVPKWNRNMEQSGTELNILFHLKPLKYEWLQRYGTKGTEYMRKIKCIYRHTRIGPNAPIRKYKFVA